MIANLAPVLVPRMGARWSVEVTGFTTKCICDWLPVEQGAERSIVGHHVLGERA